MKKILLLAMASLGMNYSQAQFTKGQQLFGPSFSFSTYNSSRDEITPNNNNQSDQKNFNISLGFDYLKLVSDKKAKGWKINYGFANGKSTTEFIPDIRESKSNQHTIGAAYFVRNFIAIKPKFNFYYDVVFGGSYGFGKTYSEYIVSTSNNQTSSIKNYDIRAFITPGFTYQIKKNILIDASLNSLGSIGYYNRKQTYSGNFTPSGYVSKESGFNASSSLSAGALLSNFYFSIKWIR